MLFTKNGTRKLRSFTIATLSVMFASAFFLASGGTAAASTNANPIVTSSSLGEFAPIFAGPAATGCDVQPMLVAYRPLLFSVHGASRRGGTTRGGQPASRI